MAIYIKEQETLLLFAGLFVGAVRGLSLAHTTEWNANYATDRDKINELNVDDNRESGLDDYRFGYTIRITNQKIQILSVYDDKEIFQFNKDYGEKWNKEERSSCNHKWEGAWDRFDTQHGSYHMGVIIDEMRRVVRENRVRVAPLIATDNNNEFQVEQDKEDEKV